MALINCPECGKNISDKAQICIHCGYPIKSITNSVKIKMPLYSSTLFIKNKEYGLIRNIDGFLLWKGKIGTLAEFKIDCSTDISIKFFWGFGGTNKIGTIHPGKTYQIIQDPIVGYNLSEIQIID